jgi:hypothetical protein
MEAIRSSETSVQSTTSTQRHTPEDGILHSHRRENLKSYNLIFVLNPGNFGVSSEARLMRWMVWPDAYLSSREDE